MYPSISNGCSTDGGNVLATALSVAGPAKIPAPGPAAGQTAYVFTAIGTPGPAAEQKLPLNVTWVNLTNGRSGSATLKPSPEINPDGPTTLIAIACLLPPMIETVAPLTDGATWFNKLSAKDGGKYMKVILTP